MTTTPLRFGLKFIIGFAILMGAFEVSRGSAFERFLVVDLIIAPTAALINWATPNEHVVLIDRTLMSAGANLHITRGCEGVEMFILLIAAILAFPANLGERAKGLLMGSVLAYALSISRLMALHYILRYSPNAWEALHGLVLPLAPIIAISLYFMWWSGRIAQISEHSLPHAA